MLVGARMIWYVEDDILKLRPIDFGSVHAIGYFDRFLEVIATEPVREYIYACKMIRGIQEKGAGKCLPKLAVEKGVRGHACDNLFG